MLHDVEMESNSGGNISPRSRFLEFKSAWLSEALQKVASLATVNPDRNIENLKEIVRVIHDVKNADEGLGTLYYKLQQFCITHEQGTANLQLEDDKEIVRPVQKAIGSIINRNESPIRGLPQKVGLLTAPPILPSQQYRKKSNMSASTTASSSLNNSGVHKNVRGRSKHTVEMEAARSQELLRQIFWEIRRVQEVQHAEAQSSLFLRETNESKPRNKHGAKLICGHYPNGKAEFSQQADARDIMNETRVDEEEEELFKLLDKGIDRIRMTMSPDEIYDKYRISRKDVNYDASPKKSVSSRQILIGNQMDSGPFLLSSPQVYQIYQELKTQPLSQDKQAKIFHAMKARLDSIKQFGTETGSAPFGVQGEPPMLLSSIQQKDLYQKLLISPLTMAQMKDLYSSMMTNLTAFTIAQNKPPKGYKYNTPLTGSQQLGSNTPKLRPDTKKSSSRSRSRSRSGGRSPTKKGSRSPSGSPRRRGQGAKKRIASPNKQQGAAWETGLARGGSAGGMLHQTNYYLTQNQRGDRSAPAYEENGLAKKKKKRRRRRKLRWRRIIKWVYRNGRWQKKIIRIPIRRRNAKGKRKDKLNSGRIRRMQPPFNKGRALHSSPSPQGGGLVKQPWN